MSLTVVEKTFTVVNALGLHARAAAQLVKVANKFTCEVSISKDGQTANAKSIMGVLMLAATHRSEIVIKTEGEDAEAAMVDLAKLIQEGFGEGVAK